MQRPDAHHGLVGSPATKARPSGTLAGFSAASLVHSLFSDETLGRLLAIYAVILVPLIVGDALPAAVFHLLEVAIAGNTLLLIVVRGQVVGRYLARDRTASGAV